LNRALCNRENACSNAIQRRAQFAGVIVRSADAVAPFQEAEMVTPVEDATVLVVILND